MDIPIKENIKEPTKDAQAIVKALNEQLDKVEKARTPSEYVKLTHKPLAKLRLVIAFYRKAFLQCTQETKEEFYDVIERWVKLSLSKGDEMLTHSNIRQSQVDIILDDRSIMQNAFDNVLPNRP